MKKQKICIIGGSLTGLVTAISLSKLNCEIDLIVDDFNKNLKSNRTIAISENNLDFLEGLRISKSLKKEMWPCEVMQLYTENKYKKFLKIFDLYNDNKKKKIFYIQENNKIMRLMMAKIKKNKSISLINNTKVDEISNSGILKNVKYNNNYFKYNLVILCTGYNSNLVKNLFNEQAINNTYNEFAITTIINHASVKNNTARQIFLDNEILALLPISNTKTSVVWSVKNDMYKKNNSFFKKKIKFYAQNFLKNIKFATKIKHADLNLLLREKFYKKRILLFGDALHRVHPLAGQGFNMTLRDLINLEKTLKSKLALGMDIGNADVLSEFSRQAKPRNLVYLTGIDFIKKFFSIKEKNFKGLRNKIVSNLNKNNTVKDFFLSVMAK